MGILNKIRNMVRADTVEVDDILLSALFPNREVPLTREQAKQIPAVNACIDMIASTVSGLPLKLYRQTEKGVEAVTNDIRVDLLNKDTGDTLTAKQFWRMIIEDYYLGNGAYAYINRCGTRVKSIHYVENEYVSVIRNENPIWKDFDIYVDGEKYYPFEFLKFLRKTRNGSESVPLTEESRLIFSVAYQSLIYEETLVKKGGNKRGFLQSAKKLTQEAIDKLKEGFKKLYNNNQENVIVLNDGITFKEASNTSVEMQLNESKEANNIAIAGAFKIPYPLIGGSGATKEHRENFMRFCIAPLLADLECSIDRDLLQEREKAEYYFAFDTKELTRGNIEERYKAYEIGLKNNFLQVDEVRDKEDLEPLGIEWIRLGLDSVLYDPKTKMIYTPNTNETKQITENKMMQQEQSGEGVKENEDRIKE